MDYLGRVLIRIAAADAVSGRMAAGRTSGVLVARSREPERYVGQKGTPAFLARYSEMPEGVYRDRPLDGTQVYGAYSAAATSRWIAGVAVPVAVVEAGFRQS